MGESTDFHDHFSGHADLYARFRPRYPALLFDRLAELAPRRELAWDCATGSGQAALGLAERFERVVATDASEAQIERARPHPRVLYRVGREADSGLPDGSVDLATVAQAFHWIGAEAYWREARRVLRPDGIAAVWMYRLTRVSEPIDEVVEHYYREVVGPYWPPERRHIETGYGDLPFPLDPIETPEVAIEHRWELARFCAYASTWSATRRRIAATGVDPVPDLERRLRPLWGAGARPVRWPLVLRVGRLRPR